MSTTIDDIERSQLRSGLPEFAPGDRVKVHFLVIEGSRSRPQVFEGVVIKRQGSGVRETFTVRKQSFGVGVERTFPVHSPKIEKLEVTSRGRVRRAKLYYLRGRTGKAARVSERRWGIDEEVLAAESDGAVDASGEGLAPEEEEQVVVEEVAEGGEDVEVTEAEGDGEATGPEGADDTEGGHDGGDEPAAEASDAEDVEQVQDESAEGEGDEPAGGDEAGDEPAQEEARDRD